MLRTALPILVLAVLMAGGVAAHPHEGEGGGAAHRAGEAVAPAHPRASKPPPARYGTRRKGDRWHAVLGGGAGFGEPWQGSGGVAANGHALASSPSGRFRIGVDFLYREWETRIFEVSDVDVDSYEINLVFHYVPFPKALATPYVGAGLGIQIHDVSKTEVESASGFDVRDDTGLGYGFTGILGVEVSLGPHVGLFAEGRLTAAYMLTGEDEDDNELYADYYHRGVDDVEVEDSGAATALGGIRLRF